MNISFGIDLGTTSSCIFRLKSLDDSPEKLEVFAENYYIPSLIYYGKHGDYAVGNLAEDKEPMHTIYDNKRFIGQKFESVQHLINNYPFTIERDMNNNEIQYRLIYDDKEIVKTSVEVHAAVLKCIKGIISKTNDFKGGILTISHPAYFTALQKLRTQEAGMSYVFVF